MGDKMKIKEIDKETKKSKMKHILPIASAGIGLGVTCYLMQTGVLNYDNLISFNTVESTLKGIPVISNLPVIEQGIDMSLKLAKGIIDTVGIQGIILAEKWIDIGSGRGGIINPLQIKEVPLDDENEEELGYKDEGKGMGAMALHFQTLRTFFKLLYPELNSIQIAYLEEVLEELYGKFGITWDTDITGIPNNKFPIMTDLYNMLEQKANSEKDKDKQKVFATLKSLFRGISIGAEKGLFNGYTSVNDMAQVVCFDTFNLQNASDRIKKAQYFNVLTYCWEIMSKDKEEKTMLVCDEAYLLIDPEVPQTLIFLRNVAKRCRKYEGSLVIISHSIVDFLDSSVKMYGQAILDMATYKILMGTDGQNLEESTELFKLSEAQAEFLYKKKRGLALFIIGSNRIFVRFDIFPIEFEYFGKGGGR